MPAKRGRPKFQNGVKPRAGIYRLATARGRGREIESTRLDAGRV